MFLVLMGAPASGKGTQAEKICAYYKIPHISTGDILRQNIREDSIVGKAAYEYISKGMLVPDDIVMETVKSRLAEGDCEKGFLLDGFPRTLNQAMELDKIYRLDKVINPSVPYDILVKRVSGRKVCKDCNKNYHNSVYHSGFCVCGGGLFTRDDDREETFKTRYDQYKQLTYPLKEYYIKQGKFIKIDGSGSPEEVFELIKAAIAG